MEQQKIEINLEEYKELIRQSARLELQVENEREKRWTAEGQVARLEKQMSAGTRADYTQKIIDRLHELEAEYIKVSNEYEASNMAKEAVDYKLKADAVAAAIITITEVENEEE